MTASLQRRGEELAVAVIGAGGRMGRWAVELLERTPGLRVAGCVRRGDDWSAVCLRGAPRVALDVTAAGLGAEHGHRLLDLGVRPVIGTSGVQASEVEGLDEHARELGLGGLVVPNFCLGVVALQRAAEQAARWFRAVEIVETHRPHKLDAPSGTALDTARRIEAARRSLDTSAGDRAGPVPIESRREPGLVARHEVVFTAAGERLRLVHEVTERDAFGPGLLLALRHAATAKGVRSGLEAALEPPAGDANTRR